MSKEDTWRALNDKAPIMNWRCRFGWHRWTTYSIRDRSNDFMNPVATCSCADCNMPRYEHPYSKTNKYNA